MIWVVESWVELEIYLFICWIGFLDWWCLFCEWYWYLLWVWVFLRIVVWWLLWLFGCLSRFYSVVRMNCGKLFVMVDCEGWFYVFEGIKRFWSDLYVFGDLFFINGVCLRFGGLFVLVWMDVWKFWLWWL